MRKFWNAAPRVQILHHQGKLMNCGLFGDIVPDGSEDNGPWTLS